jgi:hypothetical protein
VAIGFDAASGNKLNDHHYYYARFFTERQASFSGHAT